MGLNCKQGDLAYIVAGPSFGVPVRCVERYDGPWTDQATGRRDIYAPGWRLDRPVLSSDGCLYAYRQDRWLRPFRGLPDSEPESTATEQARVAPVEAV